MSATVEKCACGLDLTHPTEIAENRCLPCALGSVPLDIRDASRAAAHGVDSEREARLDAEADVPAVPNHGDSCAACNVTLLPDETTCWYCSATTLRVAS